MKVQNFFVALFLIVFISSCNQDDKKELTLDEIANVIEVIYSDEVFNEVDADVEDDVEELDSKDYVSSSSKSAGNEVNITISQGTFPKTITFDYGSGFTRYTLSGTDSIVKKGTVTAVLSDTLRKTGSEMTITYGDDFYVNDVKVEGERKLTNLGISDSTISYSVEVKNGKLTTPEGLTYTRETTQQRVWKGNTPLNWQDNELTITGTATGTNWFDQKYTRTVTEELQLKRCVNQFYRWTIIKGKMNIEIDYKTYLVDFGTGDCDRIVEVSTENASRSVRY